MRHLALLLLVLALAACAATPSRSTEPTRASAAAAPAAAPSVLDRAVRRDRVLIAGQPAAAEFERLRALGITRVVNVRTPEETDDRSVVDFDEAALVGAAGVAYEQIPIGGTGYPFRPEALAAFARSLEASDGNVLLHCAGGGRAAMLYAAYEVKYGGKTPDEALRGLEAFGGWPLPLERLTGMPLEVRVRERR
jgi:uncharacterized protein (TIGR01244 family)